MDDVAMANMINDLDGMARQVRKSLHWAAFLVVIMALILVIDLQLKKSIGELAVEVARGRGQAPHPAGSPAAASDGDHGVVGAAGLAAGSDPGPDPGTVAQDPDVDGPKMRTRGNGRRAGGPQ